MSKPEKYGSVWDAIADTPEQAANCESEWNECDESEKQQHVGQRFERERRRNGHALERGEAVRDRFPR